MKIGTRPLLLLHADPAFRERVAAGAEGEYRVEAVEAWTPLRGRVQAAPPSALVLVDPYHGTDGSSPAGELRGLLEEFPSAVVFAALEVRPERVTDLRALGEWGVVQIVSVGHDDTPEAMAVRFRQSQGRPLRALLEGVLPEETSSRARAIVDAAAGIVAAGGHGRDLARQLGLSRRTLLRWCEQSGLPPSRRLLAWMRILLAAQLLDDPGRSVLTVAQACGYSSDSGLRRVTQKFVGASPSEMRRRGAFTRASRVFLEMLERYRRRLARLEGRIVS
jgi:AraC-like DNA-binding protein